MVKKEVSTAFLIMSFVFFMISLYYLFQSKQDKATGADRKKYENIRKFFLFATMVSVLVAMGNAVAWKQDKKSSGTKMTTKDNLNVFVILLTLLVLAINAIGSSTKLGWFSQSIVVLVAILATWQLTDP